MPDYRNGSKPSFWCNLRDAIISNDRGYCRNVCRLACKKSREEGWGWLQRS